MATDLRPCRVRLATAVGLLSICVITGPGPSRAESLYREDTFRPLIADARAQAVGDVLTVQVYEISNVSTSTDVNTQRKNNVSVAASNASSKPKSLGLDTHGDFQGGGSTQRSSRLLATLTVTVKDIQANGDLVVGGDQILMINGERQFVFLEGRVRPQDITDNNSVLSTRLADARITFVGEGDLSERQKKAWWRNILDWLGV